MSGSADRGISLQLFIDRSVLQGRDRKSYFPVLRSLLNKKSVRNGVIYLKKMTDDPNNFPVIDFDKTITEVDG